MVGRLSDGPATVGQLGEGHGLSKPAITKHLDVLQAAGLITRTKRGRTIECALVPTTVHEAEAWLADRRSLWSRKLDRLAELLEEDHD